MVVIWGLDLKEMKWGKFKSSYMFGNTDYHLRRTKFVVYQCAMISCVVSESLGTAALSDYVDQQSQLENLRNADPPRFGATEYNDDFVGIASYNIFVGIYVATIFGAGFFFDLFWPERYESKSVKIAWRVCAILASIMCLASALALTVIVATRHAYVTGIDAAYAMTILKKYSAAPFQYRHNGRAVASVVFIWLGLVGTIASTIVLLKSYAHNDKHGPWSSHAAQAGKGKTAEDIEIPSVTIENEEEEASKKPVQS
ncbi:MAG: hypothetical protein M1834_009446 [Cirrosporium novae-zelandiae]|nr:MAG: hypothetical protein M1834_009446 [Cirrosporium novae-zelandiae]